MKRIIGLVLLINLLLVACSNNDSDNEIKAKQKSTESTTKEIETTTIQQNINVVEKLNVIQQDSDLISIDFYDENMCVLINKSGNKYLYKYNTTTWEEKSVQVEISNTEFAQVICSKEGIIVKDGCSIQMVNNYIFDNELNQITEARGIMVDYCLKGDKIYYYDEDSNNLNEKDINTGEIKSIREFVDGDNAKDDDIVLLNELCMSDDGNYIFYTGNYWTDEGTKECWGWFDIDDISGDVMKKENKTLKKSDNRIIVTDCKSGNYMMGQSPDLSKIYNIYTNGIDKAVGEFENVKESDSGMISSEGNVMVTSYYTGAGDTYVIYDLEKESIIAKYENDERIWIDDGIIFERGRMILYLEYIFESEEVLRPTGKYNIQYLEY